MKRQIFTAEHDAFRETVRTFLAKEVAAALRAVGEGRHRLAARPGWRPASRACSASPCPRSTAAAGNADFRYSAVLAEEFTRAGAAGLALGLHNDIIGPYLTGLATEEQKRRWLPGFCSGEIITAIAMTEPGAGSDLQGIRTTPRTGATTGCSTAPRPSSPTASSPTW